MKANRLLLVVTMSALFLAGCSPKEPAPIVKEIASNENVPVLNAQFHGKYKIIRSTSSEAIDVNLDGRVSTDMLTEVPQLDNQYGAFLELRIYPVSASAPTASFLFTQGWPEQYIRVNNSDWQGESISYQPGLNVSYSMQGTSRYFTFSPDLKRIAVQSNERENPFRWVKPESVTVNADNTIGVVNKRTLYTSAGVKEVLITTVYERFTMST